MEAKAGLLGGELRVVNLGLELFADSLEGLGVAVVRVDWSPPAGGDERLAGLLRRLEELDRPRASE